MLVQPPVRVSVPSLPNSLKDRPERGLESQAFSGREIGGDENVLDFFVGYLVDVDLTRQPAAKSAVGVFDPAFLPRGIGIARPSGHGAHGSWTAPRFDRTGSVAR
jgi:hypothetical protein